MKKACPDRRGFTLIELLIVIAILGGLATIAMLSFRGSQASSRDTRRQSDVRQYQAALEVYANRSNSLYPITPSAVNVITLCGASQLNIPNCPNDPTTGQNYRYQSSASGLGYVLWARMERPNSSGQIEYFILCSNGQAGKSTTQPSSGTCPL